MRLSGQNADLEPGMTGFWGLLRLLWRLAEPKIRRDLSLSFNAAPRYKYPLILGFIILFHIVNNAIWLRIDTIPPLWDEASYMVLSLLHYNALMAEGIPGLLKSFIYADPVHAPLVSVLPLPLYLTIGISEDKTLIVNMIAFAILLVSIYKIGERLISASVGALAVFLVSMYPVVFGLSRIFLVECALIAVVTLSIYLLLLTEGFTKRRESIWSGIVLGLGMLTKVFFPIFMFGPIMVVLYYTVQGWLQSHRPSDAVGKSARWSKWVNLSICAAVAFIIASVWYIPNMASVISRSLSVSYGEVAKLYGPDNPLTLTALVSYFILFSSYDISFLGLIILLISFLALVSGWFSRSFPQQVNQTTSKTSAFWLLLSWIIVPYVIFSTAPNQDLKHISPIVPAMALLSAWGVLAIKQRVIKLALIAVLALGGLLQFFGVSYGVSGLPKNVTWKPPLVQAPQLALFWQSRTYAENPHSYVPSQENWGIQAILEYIERINQREKAGRAAVVGIVPSYPTFEINAFMYYALRQKMPFSCIWVAPSEEPREIDYRSNLLTCDFVVVKSGYQGPAFANRYNNRIFDLLEDPTFGFIEAPQKFDLPDGSQAAIFFQQGPVLTSKLTPQFPTSVNFVNKIELLGYDLSKVESGDQGAKFHITYYWKCLDRMDQDYRIFVHITESKGDQIVAQQDHYPVHGRYSTSQWQKGEMIRESYEFSVPSDVPRGTYAIRIGLDIPEREALKVVSEQYPMDWDGHRVVIGYLETR